MKSLAKTTCFIQPGVGRNWDHHPLSQEVHFQSALGRKGGWPTGRLAIRPVPLWPWATSSGKWDEVPGSGERGDSSQGAKLLLSMRQVWREPLEAGN
jgi:hypothetical protein